MLIGQSYLHSAFLCGVYARNATANNFYNLMTIIVVKNTARTRQFLCFNVNKKLLTGILCKITHLLNYFSGQCCCIFNPLGVQLRKSEWHCD